MVTIVQKSTSVTTTTVVVKKYARTHQDHTTVPAHPGSDLETMVKHAESNVMPARMFFLMRNAANLWLAPSHKTLASLPCEPETT